jgi:hypothetical protein
MSHWLIIYKRSEEKLLACDPFEDPRAALAERFRLERDAHPDVEIVVLGAESLEALKVTHGRYFMTVPELAGRMLSTLETRSER